MSVFLFDELIFGPVRSRRLGISLGINLLPKHSKLCTFNCIYCECGWTKNRSGLRTALPTPTEFADALTTRLSELKGTALQPQSLTFAGNGEPTMHPDFPEIIRLTLEIRDKMLPDAKVSVLSNGSMIHQQSVAQSLRMVDNNILKLDGGKERTIKAINMPLKSFKLEEYIQDLQKFNGHLIIQTLFVRGYHNGEYVDNTTEGEIEAWIDLLRQINPKFVMLYSLERDTPLENLEKVSAAELNRIADYLRQHEIDAEVYS
ncbi:MAG TPA: radical SAM protein [Bacteroidales bacterium]|nr:radical SAM protein [Bacteroidales bacterium]